MRSPFTVLLSSRAAKVSRRSHKATRRSVPKSMPPVAGRLGHETLESRICLSADCGIAGSTLVSQLQWNGQTVSAQAEAWVVRTAGLADSLALDAASGWSSSSLGEGFFSLTAPGASVQDVLGWAASTEGVAYVEPDFLIEPAAVPNDPSFGSLWGLNNTGQSGGLFDADIDAVEAWQTTTGSRDVVIAVIDSGIDYTHPDLAANIWTNPGEIPGDGIDNDGNGYVDDVHGYDFYDNDGDPMDDNSHGTHVAGTIGAVGDNGRGMTGVNWQVSMMGLRFLGGNGSGSTSGAIGAINYATRMRRDFGVNVVATNNSWGGGGYSTSLRDAIEAGGEAGILFVAAAGNSAGNNDSSPSYPASYDSDAIISVAATDRSSRLAGFSNFGATSVDVAAPGVSIYSTTPNNSYASYSGTSMAAPHVAGVIGLLAAANPDATAAELREAILTTTTPVAGLDGRVATGGLINAEAALAVLGGDAPLRADIVNVSPDPRYDGVESIVIEFSRDVSGFDISDVTLALDGSAVALDAATLEATSGSRYVLGGLADATAAQGVYTLTLVAAGSGIVDADGLPLEGDVADSWNVIEPPPPAPFEPNDTLATAAVVTLVDGSATVSAEIGDGVAGRADVDLFAVELAAGATITLDIDARSLAQASGLDSYLRLFDGSGREIAANDDTGGSYDSRLSHTVAGSGRYYVGVSSYGNSRYNPAGSGATSGVSTGAYSLSFEVELPQPLPPPPPPPPPAPPAPPAPFEPNDTLATAFVVELSVGSAVLAGEIGDGAAGRADVDLFALTLEAGSVLSLDVDARSLADPSRLDSYLRLFDTSGREIARNDDTRGSLDSALTHAVSQDGTYYVGISSYGNSRYNPAEGSNRWGRTTGRYELSFSVEVPPPPPPAPLEPNDSIASASVVELTDGSATLSGVIGDGAFERADVDLFAVTVPAGSVLSLDVDARSLADPSRLDSYLRLFDATGREIARNDDTRGSYDSALTHTATEGGTYYVGLSAFGNSRYSPLEAGSGRRAFSFGHYELTVSVSEPPAVVGDAGDTLASAAAVSLADGPVRFAAAIGDSSRSPWRDVDLYAVDLAAGQQLSVDIDARTLPGGSRLDSYLRLFDADGREIARNDDANGSLDSFLTYTAAEAGRVYVGVSGYGNSRYSPTRSDSGWFGSRGSYEIEISATETLASRIAALATSQSVSTGTGPSVLGFPDAAPPSGVVSIMRRAAFASLAEGGSPERSFTLQPISSDSLRTAFN